jgi:hypothetical protein
MARAAQSPGGYSDLVARLERLERNATAEASRQRNPVAPVVSGAGKTAAADGDFDIVPPDGAVVVVLNTTDSTVRLSLRVAGAWKTSAALS